MLGTLHTRASLISFTQQMPQMPIVARPEDAPRLAIMDEDVAAAYLMEDGDLLAGMSVEQLAATARGEPIE